MRETRFKVGSAALGPSPGAYEVPLSFERPRPALSRAVARNAFPITVKAAAPPPRKVLVTNLRLEVEQVALREPVA